MTLQKPEKYLHHKQVCVLTACCGTPHGARQGNYRLELNRVNVVTGAPRGRGGSMPPSSLQIISAEYIFLIIVANPIFFMNLAQGRRFLLMGMELKCGTNAGKFQTLTGKVQMKMRRQQRGVYLHPCGYFPPLVMPQGIFHNAPKENRWTQLRVSESNRRVYCVLSRIVRSCPAEIWIVTLFAGEKDRTMENG